MFDKLTVLSKVEGLTTLSRSKGKTQIRNESRNTANQIARLKPATFVLSSNRRTLLVVSQDSFDNWSLEFGILMLYNTLTTRTFSSK